MSKFWRIFRHEYTRHVLRRRFLIALLSVPLWVVCGLGFAILSVLLLINHTPVGYVDSAGIIAFDTLPEQAFTISRVPFIPYPTEEEARGALKANKIQAYVVLPADYRQNPGARVVYLEQPSAYVTGQVRSLLLHNLLAGQSEDVTQRVINGPSLVIHDTSEQREGPNNDLFKIAAPIAAGIFLMASMFTSSGYLMQAVVEEKENRTIEILVTSVSPETVMSAKTLALISVGLTQVLAWSAFPLLGILLVGSYLPFLQSVVIDWKLVGMIFLMVLPTFVLVAALMAAVGATVTDEREGQQVSGIVMMPVMIPFMLFSVIAMHPTGLFAQALSFFPLTAAMSMLLRMGFATVPTWEVLLSAALLILSAVGALWLSGRVFRMGMLRYGKRLGWKEILQAAAPRRILKPPANGKKVS